MDKNYTIDMEISEISYKEYPTILEIVKNQKNINTIGEFIPYLEKLLGKYEKLKIINKEALEKFSIFNELTKFKEMLIKTNIYNEYIKRKLLNTDIEEVIMERYPLIKELINQLKRQGQKETITLNAFLQCSDQEIQDAEQKVFKNKKSFLIDQYYEQIYSLMNMLIDTEVYDYYLSEKNKIREKK